MRELKNEKEEMPTVNGDGVEKTEVIHTKDRPMHNGVKYKCHTAYKTPGIV